MAAIQGYSGAPRSPNDAVVVDLSSTDWTAPALGVDTASTPQGTSKIYIGGSGDIVVVPAADPAGAGVTLHGHPVGWAEICITKILKAGTTATGIVAWF